MENLKWFLYSKFYKQNKILLNHQGLKKESFFTILIFLESAVIVDFDLNFVSIIIVEWE